MYMTHSPYQSLPDAQTPGGCDSRARGGRPRFPTSAPELLSRGADVRREVLQNAIALVDKPMGVTAADVCERLRAVSGTRVCATFLSVRVAATLPQADGMALWHDKVLRLLALAYLYRLLMRHRGRCVRAGAHRVRDKGSCCSHLSV